MVFHIYKNLCAASDKGRMKTIWAFTHGLTGSNDCAQDYNCLGDCAVFLTWLQENQEVLHGIVIFCSKLYFGGNSEAMNV